MIKSYWLEGGQVFNCDGYAYGVAPDLQNVCIGTETEILKALDENKKTDNRMINNILVMEINNRGKELMGRSRATAYRRRR